MESVCLQNCIAKYLYINVTSLGTVLLRFNDNEKQLLNLILSRKQSLLQEIPEAKKVVSKYSINSINCLYIIIIIIIDNSIWELRKTKLYGSGTGPLQYRSRPGRDTTCQGKGKFGKLGGEKSCIVVYGSARSSECEAHGPSATATI